jgi:hypothetical protein
MYRYYTVSSDRWDAEQKRSQLRAGPDGIPAYVYARTLLAAGKLNDAKFVVSGLRDATLLQKHYKALTSEALAAFAGDLERRIGGDFSDLVVGSREGLTSSAGSVMELCQVLSSYKADFTLDLSESLNGYQRRSVKRINGVWQGACYPFREGLATGIMNVEFSPKGQLIAGGFTTSSQWPVRGKEPFALQRIDWNGVVPFEIREINIRKDGFLITVTQPVDKAAASNPDAYRITTYTHVYDGGYGSPEVDQTTARVTGATPSADGLSVRLSLDKITEDHIHDFDLSRITSQAGKPLLHTKAYYTVNEIPRN